MWLLHYGIDIKKQQNLFCFLSFLFFPLCFPASLHFVPSPFTQLSSTSCFILFNFFEDSLIWACVFPALFLVFFRLWLSQMVKFFRCSAVYITCRTWNFVTAAYKNAVREQRLALEISAGKEGARDFYLSKVDKSRALRSIEERLKKVSWATIIQVPFLLYFYQIDTVFES